MDILEKISKGKIRGYLTVNKRIIFEGATYHITQRAPGKEYVFLEDNDYLYFLKILKSTSQKFHLQIFSFVLLPNHLHLLLQITQKNLSVAMKNLFERYADYFNKKYQRKGHVFCGRFRASLCNDETYFLAISVYIHLNPYRAGLCEDFRDYRWTSLHLYIDRAPATFITFEKILSLLDKDPQKARQQYIEMLTNSMKLKGSSLLDSSSIQAVLREGARIVKEMVRVGNNEDLDKLIDQFKGKERMVKVKDKKAREYVIEQLLANGYSPKEIREILGFSKATFHRIVAK